MNTEIPIYTIIAFKLLVLSAAIVLPSAMFCFIRRYIKTKASAAPTIQPVVAPRMTPQMEAIAILTDTVYQ